MSDWDILLLDTSGSMIMNKDCLVDGFNELISTQKKLKPGGLFTTVTFAKDVVLFKEDTFANFTEVARDDIKTAGTTSLYDAVGSAYDMILKNDYKNITLTVITDGVENSSQFYTVDKLNHLKEIIDEKYTINITFIGTDISCITEETIVEHACQSFDTQGDIYEAFKLASREISRDDAEWRNISRERSSRYHSR